MTPAPKVRLTPGSQPWRAACIRDLGSGYGVEDIALRMGCTVDQVREVVTDLRERGLLTDICRKGKKSP